MYCFAVNSTFRDTKHEIIFCKYCALTKLINIDLVALFVIEIGANLCFTIHGTAVCLYAKLNENFWLVAAVTIILLEVCSASCSSLPVTYFRSFVLKFEVHACSVSL